jgi:5-methylcytosine-specific restriction endonuclease McrA
MLNSTYEPLRVVSWRRAITMLCLGKVEVVRSYETRLRSVSWTVEMPAVIRLTSFVRRHRIRVAFSRRNIFLRDGYRCQYCNERFPANELTCDHLVPRSRGGRSSWENLVTACGPCNRRKGDRSPEQARMKLLRQPRRPDSLPGVALRLNTQAAPEQWRDFLAWAKHPIEQAS